MFSILLKKKCHGDAKSERVWSSVWKLIFNFLCDQQCRFKVFIVLSCSNTLEFFQRLTFSMSLLVVHIKFLKKHVQLYPLGIRLIIIISCLASAESSYLELKKKWHDTFEKFSMEGGVEKEFIDLAMSYGTKTRD